MDWKSKGESAADYLVPTPQKPTKKSHRDCQTQDAMTNHVLRLLKGLGIADEAQVHSKVWSAIASTAILSDT